jgi:2,5-diketo-D-gluconate reductase A
MGTYQLVGLGTYKIQDEQCTQIVKTGLEIGYRLIDTAQLYRNHNFVSQGIKLSGIPRTDIFITSKIHNSNIKKLKISDAINEIKKELDTDYIDLILLHNPVKNYEKAWEELIRCKEQLNIKHIGVSNFYEEELNRIILNTGIIPWLNQIELSIFNQQKNLIIYNNSKGIITQAHTTLTKGNLLNNSDINKWSNQLNISIPELMFKYVLDQGIGILPRTSKNENLHFNFNLLYKPKLFDDNFNNLNKIILSNFDIKYKIY